MGENLKMIWKMKKAAICSSLCFLALIGCVKNSEMAQAPQRTFFASSLPPASLLKLCAQYLEFLKGYGILVRDPANGLLVTEWLQSSPFERHRITIRISNDPQGSLLSSHVLEEVFDNQRWLPNAQLAVSERAVVEELETYVKKSQSAATPNDNPQTALKH